jgi:hypothetical protein
MSIVPKSWPPEFASGKPEILIPESAFRVVDVSNSPESSAAAAVTTFIVEPGVNGSWVGRLRSGPCSLSESWANVCAFLTVFGS